MKKIYFALLCLFLSGCGTHQAMKDITDNQYMEKQIYSDAKAEYIGEWTGATGPTLLSLKILPDGSIKACSSNEVYGQQIGKVYLDEGDRKFIFDSGTRYSILEINEDSMLLEAYGIEYKFYSGQVPERCQAVFSL